MPRDSIRRKTDPRRDATLRRACGFDVVIGRRGARPLRKAIRKLLHAIAAIPAVRALVVITPEMVRALEASRDELTGLIARTSAARGAKRDLAGRISTLHEALETWYDDYAVAVNAAYFEDGERRATLLSLIPRECDHKKKHTGASALSPALAVASPHM